MITAKQARNYKDEGSSEIQNHLVKIDESIRWELNRDNACRQTFYDMSNSQYMTNEVSDLLEDLGYEVSWNDALLCLDIKWEKEDDH